MASPPSRRPGFSRRAQYGLFAGYVIAVAGAVSALLLALTERLDPEGHAAIQGVIGDVTMPVSRAARDGVGVAAAGFGGIAAYIDAGSKNAAMAAELRSNRSALIEAQAIRRENQRLVRLVRLVEIRLDRITTARLVASTGATTRRYATLSAGSTSGVASGQPVRTTEGLIGRVVAAGRISARVLLITDGGNVVPVRRIGDGMPALATGRGDGGLDIRALEAGSNPFKIGDVFVTSGAGGVYPLDVPVAIAKIANREAVIARPLASPNRLDFAIVESPYLVVSADLPPVERTP